MTKVALDHRPRLPELCRLGGGAEAGLSGRAHVDGATPESRRQAPRVHPPAVFEGRSGYNEHFLEGFPVPLPGVSGALERDILPVAGSSLGRLDYQHFTVVMSKSRRMARFVAVNIEGESSQRVARGDDQWFLDGRIPVDAQIGEELYVDNGLDRGHLVRREDPNWGTEDEAQIANEDTFHFTNCSPQMASMNQKTWLGLENYILQNTRRWRERVTVFSGPVFGDGDLIYRGARIPLAYWKVVAFLSDDFKPSASAYMMDQVHELGSLEATFGTYKTYQRSVRYVAERTGLDFGSLTNFDGFSNEEAHLSAQIETVIENLGDIRV